MTIPAANWELVYGYIRLYFDALDEKRLYYGPSRVWRPLTSQVLGSRFTLLQGEVDFEVSSAELLDLQSRFPQCRLSPLIASDVQNNVTLDVSITTPHVVKLALIPIIPFPKISVNITVSHDDPQHDDLVTTIQQRWNNKSLLVGDLVFVSQGALMRSSHRIAVSTVQIMSALKATLGTKDVSGVEVSAAAAVVANTGTWIKSGCPAGFPNEDDSHVQTFLAQKIIDTFFRPSEPLVVFDDGRSIKGYALIDPLSLVKDFADTLVRSQPATIRISLL